MTDNDNEPFNLDSADIQESAYVMDGPVPDHTQSRDVANEIPERVRKPLRSLGNNKKARPTTRKTKEGELVPHIEKFYAGIGLAILPIDPNCGTAVLMSAERCAKAIDRLALENDSVRRIILAMVETGAWSQVIMAHAPLLAIVALHHNRVPPGLEGAVHQVAQLITIDEEASAKPDITQLVVLEGGVA